ncbi:MAG: DUF72 domain-containing protein [Actinobacteria bacterium]|nr:DUF72 domain-containing protein [Actinomycetota bacterium]
MENGELYIGTSGWYYNSWAGNFYPGDLSRSKWLEYYSRHFNTVEINSTFYHLPKKEILSNWASQTPDDFVFVLKASKYITHIKRLSDCSEPLKKLVDLASGLGSKLGLFLFQLPPDLKKDIKRLESFVKILLKDYRYVFEFRDESWFCDEVYNLLNEFRACIAISSSPCFPYHEIIIGDLCYIRMHGSKQLYLSSYSEKELKIFSNLIKKNLNNIITHIYFNNDVSGYAVENAMGLIKYCNS